MEVQASTEYLAKVRDFVASHAEKFGFEEDQVSDIRLAVDEAFTNIIEHAYKNSAEESVKISLSHNSDTFSISLFDNGQSFSLDDYKEPDVAARIKQKKRGGVGVYLIQKLMDEVSYQHKGTENEIRMTKKR
jgi:serine/threonine-protein kinase RsbW